MIIFLLFFVLDKNLEKTFLDTSPLLHVLFSGKLRGEVFNSNHGFSAGNDMRIAIVCEGADNDNDHLPWVLYFICGKPVLCKTGDADDLAAFGLHGTDGGNFCLFLWAMFAIIYGILVNLVFYTLPYRRNWLELS